MSSSPIQHDAVLSDSSGAEGASHIEPDDIGVGLLTVLFALVAVVVLLVVVLLQAWFYNWKVDLVAARSGPIDPQQTPAALAQDQLRRIETFGWADPKTHTRAIPIELAMKLVASELGSPSDKDKPSSKVSVKK